MNRMIAKVSMCLVAGIFAGALSVAPVYAASEHGGDGKCGEGKCGAEKKEHIAPKGTPTPEAHKAKADGKCGQGKCNGSK